MVLPMKHLFVTLDRSGPGFIPIENPPDYVPVEGEQNSILAEVRRSFEPEDELPNRYFTFFLEMLTNSDPNDCRSSLMIRSADPPGKPRQNPNREQLPPRQRPHNLINRTQTKLTGPPRRARRARSQHHPRLRARPRPRPLSVLIRSHLNLPSSPPRPRKSSNNNASNKFLHMVKVVHYYGF